jgi:hypothetical protein
VALATRLAIASPVVTTDVIMVNLFPYLAVRYQVDDVPTMVVNGVKAVVGVCDEGEAMGKIFGGAGKGREMEG